MEFHCSSILSIINPIHFHYYQFFIIFLVIFIIRFIHYFFISPYTLQRYYIKQGFIPSTHYNLILSNKDRIQSEEDDDVMGYLRDIVNKIPNIKGLVFKLGPKVMLGIIDTKLLREMSQSQHIVKFNVYLAKKFNKYSLLRLDGEKHKRIRRILSSVFHFDYIISNIEITIQITREKFKEWEDKHWIDNDEYAVDICKESGNFAGEIIGALFFGISQNKDKIKGQRVTDYIMNLIGRFVVYSGENIKKPWIPILYELGLTRELRELKEGIHALKNYAHDLLQTKRAQIASIKKDNNNNAKQSPNSLDLTSALLKAQSTAKSHEDKLTDDEIIAQYLLFFFAGQDTTSHLVTICIYLLTQYPKYVNDIRKEIQNNIPDLDHITYYQLAKLNFLNAFIKETLRVYPPLAQITPRVAANDFILDKQYNIKKGTLITAFLLANSWKNENFHDAKDFKPERWIDNCGNSEYRKGTSGSGGGDEGSKLKDSFVYLPFWAGQRNCIGQHLALIETKIFLIELLMRYDVRLDLGYKLRMVNRILYEPLEHIRVRFSRWKMNHQAK